MIISEIIGSKKWPKGNDLGLEIEVEGRNLPVESVGAWLWTRDGSLRGEALEYISKSPRSLEEISSDLDVLNKRFSALKSTLSFSARTSVHVHVNVSYLDVETVATFGYLYLLFEEALMRYCGESRMGNRFCLRMRDAPAFIDQIIENLDEKSLQRHANYDRGNSLGNDCRYAAMNIASIPKFGSLEFRGMRGTNDKDTIVNWCSLLLSLREAAEYFKTPAKVKSYFLRHGAEKLFKKVFGKLGEVIYYKEIIQDVEYNFSLTISIPFEMRFEKIEEKEPKVERLEIDPERFQGEFIHNIPQPAVQVHDEVQVLVDRLHNEFNVDLVHRQGVDEW